MEATSRAAWLYMLTLAGLLAVLIGGVAILIILATASASAKSAEAYVLEWSEKVANGLKSGKYQNVDGVILNRDGSGLREDQEVRLTGKVIMSVNEDMLTGMGDKPIHIIKNSSILSEGSWIVLDGGKAGSVVCKFSGGFSSSNWSGAGPKIQAANVQITGNFFRILIPKSAKTDSGVTVMLKDCVLLGVTLQLP
jgi:hypothetical protein